MPKYDAIIQTLNQAQSDVDYLLEGNKPKSSSDFSKDDNNKRIAQGIYLLAQKLKDAANAYLFTPTLAAAGVEIGNCVLAINGQNDISKEDCRPVPVVNSHETFKLGIIMLKLLDALDPNVNNAANDYLNALGLAPGGWPNRIEVSPSCIYENLKAYLIEQNEEERAKLIELFKTDNERLKDIGDRLKSEVELTSTEEDLSNFEQNIAKGLSDYVGVYKYVKKLGPLANKVRMTLPILKQGFNIIQCADSENISISSCNLEIINIIIDTNGKHKLLWRNIENRISTAPITEESVLALAGNLESPPEIHEYINKANTNIATKKAYKEIKQAIQTNVYQLTRVISGLESSHVNPAERVIPDPESSDVNSTESTTSSDDRTDSEDSDSRTWSEFGSSVATNAAIAGISVLLAPVTGGSSLFATVALATINSHERINQEPVIDSNNTSVADSIIPDSETTSDATTTEGSISTTTSSNTELTPLETFINKAKEIDAKLLAIAPILYSRNQRVKNYLHEVNKIINNYNTSEDPNKKISFTHDHFNDSGEQKQNLENQFLMVSGSELTIESDGMSELQVLFEEIQDPTLTDIPEDQQSAYAEAALTIKRLDNKLKEEQAKILEAIKKKQAAFSAIKDFDPSVEVLKILPRFPHDQFIASWYLRALSFKLTPYLFAMAFAVGVAAAVISIGFLTGSPAFALFSVQALSNLVIPLCFTGAVAGSTAAVGAGTGLVFAGMYRQLRQSPVPTVSVEEEDKAGSSLA